MSIFTKIFGDPNVKEINKIQPIVAEINALENKYQALSDEELKNRTNILKEQIKTGKTLDNILPDAFAIVREAAKRTLNMRHFDTQLIGGIVLHRGEIAEMKTGEGKTLVATLPMYLNSLFGKGCHLVTPNDYLSRHGAGWMGKIYDFLGVSVGVIMQEAAYLYDHNYENTDFVDEYARHLKPCTRKEAYNCDILYGTNNEFGFDYLRDNMVDTLEMMSQRDLHYAIVDEVDSILIDEARTPLIISSPAEESDEQYRQFAHLVPGLKENEDYNIDEKMKAVTLTEDGILKVEKMLGMGNIYVEGGISTVHHLEQALRAEALFKKDRDYIVKDGEVLIIDEFTGRIMNGRRYSEGLHQAIEAKENVHVKQESRTVATITFQNYFRMYKKLAGMTGTALTEAEEFSKIYKLEVLSIPTYKPMVREDRNDKIYKDENAKYQAIVKTIKEKQTKGQPVLIGTIAIEKNEYLSKLLEMNGITHSVLNAKQHEKEAQIIANAGKAGVVTVATNMAGRGVDIILGGEPPVKFDENGDLTPEYIDWQKHHDDVVALGGLCVIGTERHESRRIDNQLRGRAGRQGDPGESIFYVCMDDDLMRIFGSDRMKRIMETLRVPDDLPIENSIISRSIESAQKKVEGHNFDIRKHVLEYDDVMNKHREVIYKRRKEILNSDDSAAAENKNFIKEKILNLVKEEITNVVYFHTNDEDQNKWDLEEIYEVVNTIFELPGDGRIRLDDIRARVTAVSGDKAVEEALDRLKIVEYLIKIAERRYEEMEKQVLEVTNDEKAMKQIQKGILLRSIDELWMEHLDTMQHLRTGIGLQGYGQRDPLVEYKKEAYGLFKKLVAQIDKQVVYSIFKVGIAQSIAPGVMKRARMILQGAKKTMDKGDSAFGGAEKRVDDVVIEKKLRGVDGEKVGRNDPCPCGSGKKYKKCHGE